MTATEAAADALGQDWSGTVALELVAFKAQERLLSEMF